MEYNPESHDSFKCGDDPQRNLDLVNEMKSIFERAGKDPRGYKTPSQIFEHRYKTGIKRFEREVLGRNYFIFSRIRADKTLDQFSDILEKIGIAESRTEGRNLAVEITERSKGHPFSLPLGGQTYLALTDTHNCQTQDDLYTIWWFDAGF